MFSSDIIQQLFTKKKYTLSVKRSLEKIVCSNAIANKVHNNLYNFHEILLFDVM